MRRRDDRHLGRTTFAGLAEGDQMFEVFHMQSI
jgi:hypothetical protein